ncbi:hypothetical protein CISIN_1g045154mg [Citrus sinensis]|uniref:Uncharacterized protein n=1 Tax=Citrus sinensis TaxID=2711 RepID=A0A067FEM6_CITSI|nr:hypothetical protein CISIN_1g045154mg [Citrus sinensis]
MDWYPLKFSCENGTREIKKFSILLFSFLFSLPSPLFSSHQSSLFPSFLATERSQAVPNKVSVPEAAKTESTHVMDRRSF